MIEEISKLEEIENLYKDGINAPYQKVEKGHGYYGVLIKDKIAGKIQCHICGRFFDNLGVHVVGKHKFISYEYKEKFGFPKNMPICSVKISRQRYEKIMRQKKQSKIGFTKRNRLYIKVKNHRGAYTYLSNQNKANICDEQLIRRYYALSDKIGKQASSRDLQKNDEALRAVIIRRFKTFNNFKKHYNLSEIIEKPKEWENDKILFALRRFYRENKIIPKEKYLRKAGKKYPTSTTIRNRFGSYNRALHMAGFSVKIDNELGMIQEMSAIKNLTTRGVKHRIHSAFTPPKFKESI